MLNILGFPGGSEGGESGLIPGSIPGSGRSSGEGNGNPLQYSCLENSMNREAWWVTVHGVAKSQTWLSNWLSHKHAVQAMVRGHRISSDSILSSVSYRATGHQRCNHFYRSHNHPPLFYTAGRQWLNQSHTLGENSDRPSLRFFSVPRDGRYRGENGNLECLAQGQIWETINKNFSWFASPIPAFWPGSN